MMPEEKVRDQESTSPSMQALLMENQALRTREAELTLQIHQHGAHQQELAEKLEKLANNVNKPRSSKVCIIM